MAQKEGREMCFLTRAKKACHLLSSLFCSLRLRLSERMLSGEKKYSLTPVDTQEKPRGSRHYQSQPVVQFTSFLARLISLEAVTGATKSPNAVGPKWWASSLWEQRAHHLGLCCHCHCSLMAASYHRVNGFSPGSSLMPVEKSVDSLERGLLHLTLQSSESISSAPCQLFFWPSWVCLSHILMMPFLQR